MVSRPRISIVVACGILAHCAGPVRGAADGLFAVFDTSMGSFTCRLDYAEAPLTVANFVRLAQRDAYPWIDLTTGAVRHDPFYDGILFHRVIDGFVIQAGSPAGDGSDGPGYSFPDEFSPGLRHDAAGVLSMANSGLNANGSQFFITLAPTPGLDDLHAVFGRVTSGLDIVQGIGGVATDDDDKPLTNVVIEAVTIVTNGPAAAAFDIGAPSLPGVLATATSLAHTGPDWFLQTTPQAGHEYTVHYSADLAAWSAGWRRLFTAAPAEAALDITAMAGPGDTAGFFAVTEVQYPGPLLVPATLVGSTVTFLINGLGPMAILLNPDGSGFWATLSDTGFINASSWTPSAYNGSFRVEFDVLVTMRFSMAFDSASEGRLRGAAYTTPPSPLTGTFAIP